MRKLIMLLFLFGILSYTNSNANIGMSMGMQLGSIANPNVTSSIVPVIGIPIEIGGNLLIEPNISFLSSSSLNNQANGTITTTNFAIGVSGLYRLNMNTTRPIIGGAIGYGTTNHEIDPLTNNGNSVEESQSRFTVAGVFGIEHEISKQFTFTLQSGINYTTFSDREINGNDVDTDESRFGLVANIVFRMFLD